LSGKESLFAPASVGFVAASLLAPRLVARRGNVAVAGGALIYAAGIGWLIVTVSALESARDLLALVPPLVLFGLGQGASMTPLINLVIGFVGERHAGMAAAAVCSRANRMPLCILAEIARENRATRSKGGDAFVHATDLAFECRPHFVAEFESRKVAQHARQQRTDRVQFQAGVAQHADAPDQLLLGRTIIAIAGFPAARDAARLLPRNNVASAH
jgi:hypothetical protein